RPVVMTIRAVMDVAWQGLPPGDASAAGEFYRNWSADEFGTSAASKVAAVYEEYFKAPARTSGAVTREYGDQLYHTEARRMVATALLDSPLFTIASQAPPWVPLRRVDNAAPGNAPGSRPVAPKGWLRSTIKTEIEECADAQPRWDALWQHAREA